MQLLVNVHIRDYGELYLPEGILNQVRSFIAIISVFLREHFTIYRFDL